MGKGWGWGEDVSKRWRMAAKSLKFGSLFSSTDSIWIAILVGQKMNELRAANCRKEMLQFSKFHWNFFGFYSNWLIIFFLRPTLDNERDERDRFLLKRSQKLNFNLKRFYFQFILLLLVTGGYSAPKPQDSYGAPAAPSTYGAPAADSYGSPQAPAVDSYGAPQAPVCRSEQSPSPIPGAECNPNPPQCVDQVLLKT